MNNLNGLDSVIVTFNQRQLALRKILDVLMECQAELDGWQLNPSGLSAEMVQFHHVDLDKPTGNPKLLAKKLGGIWYRNRDKWESKNTQIGHVVLHGAELTPTTSDQVNLAD